MGRGRVKMAASTAYSGRIPAWAISIRPRKFSRNSGPTTGRVRSTCSIWCACAHEAAYPDGRKATGAEAYAAYGRESGPVFERLGGRIVWQGRFELMLIGPAGRALGPLLHRRISKRRRLRRDDPRSRLPRSGEAPPGRGRGFPPDPARRAAGRQDVWGDTEVAARSVAASGHLASSLKRWACRRALPTYSAQKIGGPEGRRSLLPPIVSMARRA